MKIFRTINGAVALDDSWNPRGFGSEADLKKKHGELAEVKEEDLFFIASTMRKKFDHEKYYSANLEKTKDTVRESVQKDNFIVQAINNIDDIEKAANLLGKRLREWYELHNPEFSRSISNHEKFAELIQRKTKKKLLEEIGLSKSMGKDLSKEDLEPIMNLAAHITQLYALKKSHERYLETCLKEMAPNIQAVAGTLIGARLIEHVGTLRRLMLMPASTIQLLGAEKALFRHLVTGAKSPKFGIILAHPMVAQAKNKGKAARLVADKISLAAKLDFFKGEYMGDKLRKELQVKIDG